MRGLPVLSFKKIIYLFSFWIHQSLDLIKSKRGEIIPICKQIIHFRCSKYRRFTTEIKMASKKTIKDSWILLCMSIWIFSTNCSANPEPQFVHGVNPYVNTGTSFKVSIAILLYTSIRSRFFKTFSVFI